MTDLMLLAKLLVVGTVVLLVVIVVSTLIHGHRSRRLRRQIDERRRLRRTKTENGQLPQLSANQRVGKASDQWEERKDRMERSVTMRRGGSKM